MRLASAAFALAAVLGAQEQPSGVFRLPSPMPPEPPKPEAAKALAPVEAPRQLSLVYTGQPLRLPFSCTEDDIQTFGMTCTEADPCPVYAEFTAVQALGLKVLVTGNFHNGATTMYSLLLASEDSGKTWTEPHERIRHAGLDQVQFVDFETGWVSGQVLQALPRDPFFLLTNDGGKTWRQRPVYAEPKVATIEQFWFENRNSGSLVLSSGGQHERYDTQTGGDTWMVREISSKPLALRVPRAATSNADWRLRADAASKAHIIERKQSGRFERVAAFQVLAGKCAPDVKPLPEPPPPDPVPAAEPTPAPARRPASPAKPPSLKRLQ